MKQTSFLSPGYTPTASEPAIKTREQEVPGEEVVEVSTLTHCIERVKAWFRADWDQTIKTCPVCLSDTRVYKRPIHSGMIRALILLRYLGKRNRDNGEWVHVSKESLPPKIIVQLQHLEYEKLIHWGLVETVVEVGERSTGLWRLTQLGHRFLVDPSCRIERRKWLVHNKCVGSDGDDINAQEALGIKFDFQALMNSTWGLDNGQDIPF